MTKNITNGRSTARSITMGRSTSESIPIGSSTGLTLSMESHAFTEGVHAHMYDENAFPDLPPCPTCGSEICPVCKEPLGR